MDSVLKIEISKSPLEKRLERLTIRSGGKEVNFLQIRHIPKLYLKTIFLNQENAPLE